METETDRIAAKNAARFTGFAETYEAARPKMPSYPVEVITRYLGRTPETVVDLGCGTGLSLEIWKGRSARIIGVEPSGDMLSVAEKKRDETTEFVKAYAHETGLEDACADAAVCSQSFHWMEPKATLSEINRILKPGGVFATVDADWPPVCGWRAEKAYLRLMNRSKVLEDEFPELADAFFRWDKNRHLERIAESGYFRYTREILFANRESCSAERLIGLALSQGSLQSVLREKSALIQHDLDAFRKTVYEEFGDRTFEIDFSYRMRIGVK